MEEKLKSDEILEKLKGRKDRDQQVQVDEDTIQLIIFLLKDSTYAFPAEDAFEIDDNTKVYMVPGTPNYVKGVKNLRGDITTVLCLRTVLELQGEDDEAEAGFHKAIEVGSGQEAKSWELRATVSLCRLLQKQDRREEGRQLLAAIYNWFTEGFDTPDLREAQALVQELS